MSNNLVVTIRALLDEVEQMKLDRLHPLSIQAQHATTLLAEQPAGARVMSANLIDRAALLKVLRKSRDEYMHEHFQYDPTTGVSEANAAKESYLGYLEENIEFIEDFPAAAAAAAAADSLTALTELLADIDDVAVGKLPEISAATLTRARQAAATGARVTANIIGG